MYPPDIHTVADGMHLDCREGTKFFLSGVSCILSVFQALKHKKGPSENQSHLATL